MISHRFANCPPDLQCSHTYDRSLVNKSAAILFHIRDHTRFKWEGTPRYRRPDQYFVFGLQEAPPYTYADLASPGRRDYFNLTFTYRRDSDVVRPYGDFVKAPLALKNETAIDPDVLLEMVRGKTKMVAWIVSHCNARGGRDKFVAQLSSHMTIDVYGKCGKRASGHISKTLMGTLHFRKTEMPWAVDNLEYRAGQW